MRILVLVQILLSTSLALASDMRPSCALAKESTLGQSSSGLLQVSNLGRIRIRCSISPRPFPNKPGELRNGLRAETTANEISADGTRKLVPSEVNVFGGGFSPESEWVDFDIHIPLDSEELDAEARKYLAKLEGAITPEDKHQHSEEDRRKALENIRRLVYQHRVGHFQISCRVLDGTRVIGSDVVELEVLLKGHFSDLGLIAAPPA